MPSHQFKLRTLLATVHYKVYLTVLCKSSDQRALLTAYRKRTKGAFFPSFLMQRPSALNVPVFLTFYEPCKALAVPPLEESEIFIKPQLFESF